MFSIVFTLSFAMCLVWGTDGALSLSDLFDQELYTNVLDPELCNLHLAEMNAFNFYDVSFRIPQGTLRGNSVNYGLYQQCLDLRQEIAEDDVIEGKHCMIDASFSFLSSSSLPWGKELLSFSEEVAKNVVAVRQKFTPKNALRPFYSQIFQNIHKEAQPLITNNQVMRFQLGVCIPKSCSVGQALDQYLNNSIVSVGYEEGICRLPNDRPYRGGDYVALVIFSMIGLITIISTCYDLLNIFFLKKDPKDVNKLYSCCSVYSNSRQLITFGPNRGAITCLDGIRAISMLWVVTGHTVVVIMMTGIDNFMEFMEWFNAPKTIWLWAMDLSVDSFLMMSGLLLVYSSASKVTQTTFLRKLHLYYFNRYLRMFPVVAATVLFQATLIFHLSDGPNWSSMGSETIACQRYWWSALLHMQNYVNPESMCLTHLWYLAVDFQLHILSPLVLFWALGSRRQGWTAVTVALLAGLTASTIYCYLTDFNATASAKNNKYMVNTLTRAPTFLVGMFYGYLLHICRGKKLQLPKIFIILGWLCSLIILSLVIYAYYPQQVNSSEMLDNFMNAFSRTLWAIGLGVMIFFCNHSQGGPINWFLSLTLWKFISRISFAMYILHFPIQFVRMATVSAPYYFSGNILVLQMIEDVVLTTMLSIVAWVVIEAPFGTLIKIFLNEVDKPARIKSVTPSSVFVYPYKNLCTSPNLIRSTEKSGKELGPRKDASKTTVDGTHSDHITKEAKDKKDTGMKETEKDISDKL